MDEHDSGTLIAAEIEELMVCYLSDDLVNPSILTAIHSQEGEYNKKDPVIRSNHEAIVSAVQQLLEHDPSSHYQKLLDEMDPENPAEFVDLAAAVITSEPELQQVRINYKTDAAQHKEVIIAVLLKVVLETTDVKQRQLRCLELLNKKLEVFRKQKEERTENRYLLVACSQFALITHTST